MHVGALRAGRGTSEQCEGKGVGGGRACFDKAVSIYHDPSLPAADVDLQNDRSNATKSSIQLLVCNPYHV
jgi:hypothetical protein